MFRHRSVILRDSSRMMKYKSKILVSVLNRHDWNAHNIKMVEHIKLTNIKYNVTMLKLRNSKPFQVRSRSCLYSVNEHVCIYVIQRDLVQMERVKCVVYYRVTAQLSFAQNITTERTAHALQLHKLRSLKYSTGSHAQTY
jgi:hypothetical protein